MLTTGTPAPLILEVLASVGWFDWTAIAVVAVFLALGVTKGLAWQAGRLAIVVGAYLVAIVFGRGFGELLQAWFAGTDDPDLHHHVAQTILFVGVLIGVGVVAWLLQRFAKPRPLTTANRLLGGALGAFSGALLVFAALTGLHMFFGARAVVRAAETSSSATVGRRVLAVAENVLPTGLADGARAWRRLLHDPRLPPDAPPAEPGSETGGRVR